MRTSEKALKGGDAYVAAFDKGVAAPSFGHNCGGKRRRSEASVHAQSRGALCCEGGT